MTMNSVEAFQQVSLFEDTLPAMTTATPRKAAPKIVPVPSVSRVSSVVQGNTPEFRVIRSSRRKRSMSAYRVNGIIEIHIPDRMSRKDERAIIPEMIDIVLKREAKSRSSDAELELAAQDLMARYLPDFSERATSITWRSMRERWGSCTTSDGTIRISTRLNGVAPYVLDYVLFHELIHLRIAGHGADFKEILARYPDKDRAEAFLEGFEAGLGASPESISEL